MILCIGIEADETFAHTVGALRRAGVPHDVLDLVTFARTGAMTIPLDDTADAEFVVSGARVRVGDYSSVWLRAPNVSGGAPSRALRDRADDVNAALSHVFSNSPVPVLNPTLADLGNFSKVIHATSLAQVAGFTTPRSCLSNNEEEVLKFIASCDGRVIFKGASATKTWATLYDPLLHDSRLPLLRACPVLFQERIVGPDVRVHIVGDEPFGERVESPSIDYRGALGNRYTCEELPDPIAEGCRSLVRASGVPFLGIDFKVERETGRWFFLEANSMPCYAGYDRRAGGAISAAIVRWLVTAERATVAPSTRIDREDWGVTPAGKPTLSPFPSRNPPC